MNYDHKKIEKKWQEQWAKNAIYTTPDKVPGKDNFYLLVELPYPSGNLHVGHWYAFAVPDILARYTRMTGKNVLYPIGFDAFGLPAENAAIKNGVNPAEWTEANMAHMRDQIRSMGTMFDWSREVVTCHPDYYRWTQWLFLQLHKHGLVYQRETAVNWCPKDLTVLANEQVIDGICERCGSEVEQRKMLQWNIKITDYADRLIDDLEELDWPQQIKESQKNWIGRSEGAEIDFFLDFGDPEVNARTDESGKNAHITVFTTRADTLFGATYLVLAPEHPWVTLALGHKTVLKNDEDVQKYVSQASKKTELERMADQKEKTGVRLEGVEAVNPATGEKVPLYVADYVLATYGTGAIMAVPAHDERDGAFAKKFNIPMRQVAAPTSSPKYERADAIKPELPFQERDAVMCIVKHWEKDEYLCLVWNDHPDTCSFISGGIEPGEDAVVAGAREILEESGYKNARFVRQIGGYSYIEFYHQLKKQNIRARFQYLYYELADGERAEVEPEEMKKHSTMWKSKGDVYGFLNLVEKDAIWKGFLGELSDKVFTGEGRLVNSGEFDGLTSAEAKAVMTERFGRAKKTYRLRDWIVSRQRYWGVPIPMIHCDTCDIVPVPEGELPVILPATNDYLPEGTGKSPLAKVESFVNVTCPSCGDKARRETDTLDTFVDSSWYFYRYTDPKNESAFVSREALDSWMPIDLYSGGAEHTTVHVLYSRFWHKAFADIGLLEGKEPFTRRMNRSLIMGPDGQKMSKSRGNVIDPDQVVERLGADTVRMYLAFIGPYNEVASYPWNPNGVVGVRRFLERVGRAEDLVQAEDVAALNSPLHKALKKVGEDCVALKFNTAISQLMILLNAIEKEKRIGAAQWEIFITMLAPFAPHVAEELWSARGKSGSVHVEAWPEYKEEFLTEEHVTIAIQIDGKMRGEVTISSDTDKEETEAAAREVVAARLEGQEIARTVVVPGRLVNFVLKK